MNQRTTFIENDIACKQAIEDFSATRSIPLWLQQNSAFYESVTIKPKGLPRIVSFNLDGESFDNIQLFGKLYEQVLEVYE